MEKRVVSIRNFFDTDSWCHISDVINPENIPTRICKVNIFQRWFDGPQFLYTHIDVSELYPG